MTAADFGNCNQIVYRAGIRGPRSRDYAERFPAGGMIGGYRLLQFIRIELCIHVHRDSTQCFTSNSEQAGRLVERVMRFGRRVGYRLCPDHGNAVVYGFREFRRQSQSQATEIGFIAAAGESPVECAGPAHAFADPANCLELDFRRQLRARQRCKLRIQCRHQRLGQHAHVSWRGIH